MLANALLSPAQPLFHRHLPVLTHTHTYTQVRKNMLTEIYDLKALKLTHIESLRHTDKMTFNLQQL